MAHAFNSPSGMPAAIRCNAKQWRELPFPNTSNDAADEGTAAHFLLETCLIEKVPAKHHMGKRIKVSPIETAFHTSGQYPVGPEMTQEVQKVLDYIDSVANGAEVHAELNLSIAHITNEYQHIASGNVVVREADGTFVDLIERTIYTADEVEPATGTTDVTVIDGTDAHIIDLKYGRGVQVFAEANEQLAMYADAALRELDLMDEVETVHLHIAQPRLGHFDVWTISRQALAEFIDEIRTASNLIFSGPAGLTAVPGDKQCKFCRAKSTCEEYRDFVLGTIADGFVDLDKGTVSVSIDQAEKLLANAFGVTPKAVDFNSPSDGHASFTIKKPNIRPTLEAAELALPNADDERLATLMDAADMLEGFAKAVRAETERRLLLGTFTDPRYKLVQGKRGNRAWIDEQEAEAALKAMRLKVDQMYDFKLISPTAAETLLKVSNPRKWAKVEKLYAQADGKPSVAPASDKRPALNIAVADAFDVLPEEAMVDNFEDLV